MLTRESSEVNAVIVVGPETVAPAVGAPTRGVNALVVATTLSTVNVTTGDVPQMPLRSIALAKIECWPSATLLESQLPVHGDAPSHHTSEPSTYHFTCVTPSGS